MGPARLNVQNRIVPLSALVHSRAYSTTLLSIVLMWFVLREIGTYPWTQVQCGSVKSRLGWLFFWKLWSAHSKMKLFNFLFLSWLHRRLIFPHANYLERKTMLLRKIFRPRASRLELKIIAQLTRERARAQVMERTFWTFSHYPRLNHHASFVLGSDSWCKITLHFWAWPRWPPYCSFPGSSTP